LRGEWFGCDLDSGNLAAPMYMRAQGAVGRAVSLDAVARAFSVQISVDRCANTSSGSSVKTVWKKGDDLFFIHGTILCHFNPPQFSSVLCVNI